MKLTEELKCGLIIKAGETASNNITIQFSEPEKVQPASSQHFSLEELQKVVGGYIEMVRLPHNNLMFVDEEGQLKGKTLNYLATILAGQVIVGDVLLCGASMVE